VLHQPGDEPVEQIGPREKRPRVLLAERQRLRDLLAALAGERTRERVAEHSVRPLGFAGPIDRHPPGGV
jgi:hypothetical protein